VAEGETQSPGPKKCGPSISSVTSQSVNLMIQAVVLFFIGVFLASVLNLLQIQTNVTLFPPDVIASIFSSAWWVPPCCGTASAVIGLLYPCIDRHLGEPHKFKREWSSVMRCVAVFVDINHASAEVDFDNNIQLFLTQSHWTVVDFRNCFLGNLGHSTKAKIYLLFRKTRLNALYTHTHTHTHTHISAICDFFICKSSTNLYVFDLTVKYICTTLKKKTQYKKIGHD
uniref:Insulin-induced gene protein n=1 Tax=Sus scrofa TaxID=9823 RepID=A0A8D0T5U0_PIG